MRRRHRARARGPAAVPVADVEENLLVGGHRERPGPWTLERVYELFTWMTERRTAAGRPAVGWRAAGGGDRARAGGESARAAARRALARPRAGRRAPASTRCCRSSSRTGMAVLIVEQDVSQAMRVASRRPVPARGPHDARGTPARPHGRADRGGLLRPRRGPSDRAVASMNWINAIVQGLLLGGLFALFACGLSLLFGVDAASSTWPRRPGRRRRVTWRSVVVADRHLPPARLRGRRARVRRRSATCDSARSLQASLDPGRSRRCS